MPRYQESGCQVLRIWIIILAISCNTVFSFNHSILLKHSRGWKLMFNSIRLIKEVNIHIVKLSPLSLLILTIGWPISTCILLKKDFKCSMVSHFSLRKLTKEYLENHPQQQGHISCHLYFHESLSHFINFSFFLSSPLLRNKHFLSFVSHPTTLT